MVTYTKESILNIARGHIKNNKGKLPASVFGKDGLPTLRTIDRKFGGISYLRKQLGVHPDDRTGKVRSCKVKEFNARSTRFHVSVYRELLKFFPEMAIHRESSIVDDARNRTDFKIFGKDYVYFMDIFYPVHTNSLRGCVYSKVRKYNNIEKFIMNKNYKVLLVNLNDTIKSKDIILKGIPDKVLVLDFNDALQIIKQ